MFVTDPGLVPVIAPGQPGTVPDLWYLDGPLVWKKGITITIPAFFISDDASIPKILDAIPFLDRQGRSRRPGLGHDGLYSLGREKGKEWCDRMLQAFCLAEGMTAFQAGCYYQGVHLFGASSWASDERAGVVGITSGDFFTDDAYKAWVAAGSTIYS